MAIWKDQTATRKDGVPTAPEAPPRMESDTRTAASFEAPRRNAAAQPGESHIAAGLTIEGKIEGSGHIRVAGRFKGDIHVQGDLTIEAGAKVTGGVRAATVIIAGELDGNIEGANRVELLESGVLNGDLKASSLTVAAGSRMRGQVEFGWEEKPAKASGYMQESLAAT